MNTPYDVVGNAVEANHPELLSVTKVTYYSVAMQLLAVNILPDILFSHRW